MKLSRILFTAVAALACVATFAFAGDNCGAGQSAAGAKGSCSKSTSASAATCPMHGGARTASATGSCPMHGTAATAAAGANCCAGMSSAMAAGKCDAKGAAMHGACTVCADEGACDDEVRGLNAHAQVVALRNGTMIVYTADTPEAVRALQAALARHNARIMTALSAAGDDGLCGGCKSFRGAMASGKFSRELVNVKTGAQVLLTSDDRTIIRQIHEMTGAQLSARSKS